MKSFDTYRWFIEQGQSVVGHVSLNSINHVMNFWEIAYVVGQSFQGTGIGTKSVRLLIEKVFNETHLRKIIAFVHDKNIPSCRLLDRVGFKREGVLREHYIINGIPANEILFGLLRSDVR